MGRGHASLLTNLDTWHSEPFTDIWYLLIYYRRHRLRHHEELERADNEVDGEEHDPEERVRVPVLVEQAVAQREGHHRWPRPGKPCVVGRGHMS